MGNKNYGSKYGYGITDRYTIKLRYERITYKLDFDWDDIEVENIPENFRINYFELENKIGLKNDKLAFGFPIAYYHEMEMFVFDPRIYLSFPIKVIGLN